MGRMDICEGRGRLHQLIYSINICRESTKGQALSRGGGGGIATSQTNEVQALKRLAGWWMG